MARAYKRPLAVFLMAKPPIEPPPPTDYRVDPDLAKERLSFETLIAVRRARRLQRLAVELLSDLQDKPRPTAFIGALGNDPEEAAASVRAALGVQYETQRAWPGYYAAFREWRLAVESLGVLVFQFRLASADGVRGFSLSSPGAPAIVLASGDYIGARSFSLFHELAHVLREHDGMCDMKVGRSASASEVYCNRFAGALLVPAAALLAHPLVAGARRPRSWTDDDLWRLRLDFKVSREVILRRLLTLDLTTDGYYRKKRDEWLKAAARRTASSGGGMTAAERAVVERGPRFTALVLESWSSGRLSESEAADYLSVRPANLEDVAEQLAERLG
jgi:Zn-dependent peptidase ImmA (M78 family)